MDQVLDLELDEFFTIEPQSTRDLLGDYTNELRYSSSADFYPKYKLTDGKTHNFRRGDRLEEYCDDEVTVYEVCAERCTFLMEIVPITSSEERYVLMRLRQYMVLAKAGVVFPIHEVYGLSLMVLVISERPTHSLSHTVMTYLNVSHTENELRTFAKKIASDVVDAVWRLFKQSAFSEQLGYDANGVLRAVLTHSMEFIELAQNNEDLNLFVRYLNRMQGMVLDMIKESLGEDDKSFDVCSDAFIEQFSRRRSQLVPGLSVMFTPTTKAGVASDPLEVLTDRAVAKSNIQDVLKVHQCAPNEPECRLSDILGDARNPEIAALAKSTASYLFKGAGCAHYKRGDVLSGHAGRAPVYFACCGTDCEHITKVLMFDGYEYNADSFIEEVRMQQLVHEAGLGPAINTAYLSTIGGVVVMDKLDRTLLDAILEYLNHETKILTEEMEKDSGYTWTAEGAAQVEAVQNRARAFATEAADLLHRLHKHDLWHGDAHEGNFMYTRDGELKLIDFGRTTMIPRNKILTIETREFFDKTPFEMEYFQMQRGLRMLTTSRKLMFRSSRALQLVSKFVDAALEEWKVREIREQEEMMALM